MNRMLVLLGLAALLAGCQLVSSQGTPLLKLTPDHSFGCAGHDDDPPDDR